MRDKRIYELVEALLLSIKSRTAIYEIIAKVEGLTWGRIKAIHLSERKRQR